MPLVSLVSVAVSVRSFGDHSARSAYGVLGVYSCICELGALVTMVHAESLMFVEFVAVSVRCFDDCSTFSVIVDCSDICVVLW